MMRVRPRDVAGAAFYAPSADITYAMPKVMGMTLHGTDADTADHTKVEQFAIQVSCFMKDAAYSQAKWESSLKLLEQALKDLPPHVASKLLVRFFLVMFDYYWHAMRLVPDAQAIKLDEMLKALEHSTLIRGMPVEMRAAYLEHTRTYNMLPELFEAKGLFECVEEQAKEVADVKFAEKR